MFESRDFLRARWEEKAQDDRGYSTEEEIDKTTTREKAEKIHGVKPMTSENDHSELTERKEKYQASLWKEWQGVGEVCGNEVDLKRMYQQVENATLYYLSTVMEHKKDILSPDISADKEEDLGKIRQRGHDAFIANLNILSRAFAQRGLDNNWRNVVGLSRQEVTRWVTNVGDFLMRSREA